MTKVGIDIAPVARFSSLTKSEQASFLRKVFLENEREYCDGYKDRMVRYAGTYAAKEAVSKALGVKKYPFIEVEIRRDTDGKPEAFWKGKKLPISLSISHTEDTAVAIAIG